MRWGRIGLTSDMVRDQLHSWLRAHQAGSEWPDLAAVFTGPTSTQGTTNVYLTPSLNKLLGRSVFNFKIERCDTPDKRGLALLIGDQRAWQLLDGP